MTLVRQFHLETGQLACKHPTAPTPEVVRHRMRLIREEYEEVMAELERLLPPIPDGRIDPRDSILRALLKELADLRYVLEGTAVSLGLPIDAAFEAVHASNMSKRFPDGTFHSDPKGKVLKGPNYRPPDMEALVPPVVENVIVHENGDIIVGGVRITLGEGVHDG